MSGTLEELPLGWVRTTLGSLGTWVGGGTPSKSNSSFWTKGTIPWVSPKDMKVDRIVDSEDHITVEAIKQSSTQLVPKDSVLVVTRSGILQRTLPVAVNQLPVTMNQDLKALLPTSLVTSGYCSNYLRYSSQQILRDCCKDGTTVASIDLLRLTGFPILLAPLPEQRRIVAKIEALQARSRKAREALEAIPPLLEQFRQSVLAAAFRGDLTADWRGQHPDVEPASVLLERIRSERRRKWEEAELAKFKAKGKVPKDDSWKEKYVEPEPADDAELPDLPEGWCWATMGELSWDSSYGTSVKCDYNCPGVPVLRIPNIAKGIIDLTDVKRSTTDIGLSTSEFLDKNDFLIVRTNGSLDLVGRGALIDVTPSEAIHFASYLIRFRLAAPALVSRWVTSLWECSIIRRQLESMSATSAGQYNVSMSKLTDLAIPIPPLLETIEANCRIETAIRYALSAERAILTACEANRNLDQAILAKAFRGELVPQDPNDEPASVLLERIQAERADGRSSKAPRGRRKRPSTTAE